MQAPPVTWNAGGMAKLRVHNFTVSLEGYGAGPDQNADEGLGRGGERLHDWMIATRGWREMTGEQGGTEGADNDFFARGIDGLGATIMGRNMFGPIRGPWNSPEPWKGWWGDNPPYHHPVFVLTHHERDPVPMEGGTTFHFVTDGIEAALERAVDAADGLDVRLGGGASTIQQYFRAGLIDELHFTISPVLLGGGEPLLADLGDAVERYEIAERVVSPAATHFRIVRKA